jgi:hypothetical protein
MKYLEDCPLFIKGEEDNENYVAYMDTDSVYVEAEPLLRYLHPNFENMNEEEKDNALESVALKYQDLITEYYSEMALNIFNVSSHRFEMKTECTIRSAYFRATRRYAQWISKKEGIYKDEMDIKGLEFMKANFPPIFGEFFDKILNLVLKGSPQFEIDDLIFNFKKTSLGKELNYIELGNPTSVKTLDDYIAQKPKPGEIFSSFASGAPAPVKASIRYNDLLTFWGLDKKHSKIVQGDKIKWVYFKPNPYRIEALAFLDFDLPDKIKELLDEYTDKTKSFESILESKLEGFYDDLGWKLNLNPYLTKFFNFD